MVAADFKLIALYAVLVATIILRVSVEQTGYRSPDSVYYLEVAQNIVDGNGFYHSNVYPLPPVKTPENQTYFAVWPLGYPLLIAGFSFIFSLPVFWASKVVNLFFLGLCFLLFRKINKEHAYLLGLIMCSFTFLEVFSYTWSEGPFLFGLLWFVFALHQYLRDQRKITYLLHLFSSALFLFLIRYVGGFSFFILGGISVYFWAKQQYKPAVTIFISLSILIGIAGLYFYHNFLQTGYLTGGERLYPDRENLGLFSWYLFVGLFNEFFIIKNYYWRGEPLTFFLATALFQLLIMAVIYFRYLPKPMTSKEKSSLSYILGLTGFFYLTLLILVRLISPFDPFDYRISSPFTLCIYTAILLYYIQNNNQSATFKYAYKFIILIFYVSLILNLPKVYLITYFQHMLQQFQEMLQ